MKFYRGPFKGFAIRLARTGCTNRPFHPIVVIPRHKGRDAKPLEQIGSYEPMENGNNERLIGINVDRFKYWMARGAFPTQKIQELLGLAGLLPLHPMTYITAKRNAKKAEEASAEQTQPEENQEQKNTS